jgi:hypothetical protein
MLLDVTQTHNTAVFGRHMLQFRLPMQCCNVGSICPTATQLLYAATVCVTRAVLLQWAVAALSLTWRNLTGVFCLALAA